MPEIPASHRDLLDQPVASLATNGTDGHPQVTAIWFLVEDDDTIRISLNETRQKVRNLRSDAHCTFFAIDPANPYRTLEVRADASIEPDTDRAFVDRIGAKYDADMTKMDGPGEARVVVTLTPTKVNAWGD